MHNHGLKGIGDELRNEELGLWTMRNGYALATSKGLGIISQYLQECTTDEYESLKGKLRIGLQNDTEVTLSKRSFRVSQAYCSALPVSYSNLLPNLWESFARLILEATYEATMYAGLLNFRKYGNNKVFLTKVGGGAFGNRNSWIFSAIRKSLEKFKKAPLDVKIVSYGSSDPLVKDLIKSLDR